MMLMFEKFSLESVRKMAHFEMRFDHKMVGSFAYENERETERTDRERTADDA